MASSYFFLREDQKCGPVSSSQLKTMAASGLIGPDDLVWKEGFPKWIPARNLKGLFPEVSSSDQQPPLPNRIVENQPRSNSSSLRSTPDAPEGTAESENRKSPVLSEVQHESIVDQAADAVAALKKNAGDATRLVANRSERVKILNWSLPKAYAALGRDCFQNQRHENTLSGHYENLKSIQNELTQIKAKSDSLETSGTLSDKVKTGAAKAAIFAQAKVLDAKASSVLVQIGKTAFKDYGSEAGPEELVKPIQDSLSRISELDEESAVLGQTHKGKWITKKRLKYAAGAFVALTILGALVGKPEKESTIGSDENFSAIDRQEIDSDVNLRIAQEMGELNKEKLKNFLSLKKSLQGSDGYYGFAEYTSFMMIFPAKRWFEAAHKRGMDKGEFKASTIMIIGGLLDIPLKTLFENESAYDEVLKKLTGKTLSDY